MAADHDEFGYLVEIVDSVIENGREGALCATTSMQDLCVACSPVQEPPLDVIVVRAPGSLYAPSSGNVLIEHLSVAGRNDRIERPVSEAVPLFWRFASEKFGVHPSGDARSCRIAGDRFRSRLPPLMPRVASELPQPCDTALPD
jgi:hypothetical protein